MSKITQESLEKAAAIFGEAQELMCVVMRERDAEMIVLYQLIEKHFGNGLLMAFQDLVSEQEKSDD